jgi:uncharacterized protein YfcZ (UPF0381/DUF406 family)
MGLEFVYEHLELACALACADVAGLVDHRHSRGVVTAVFETFETAEKHLEALVVTDVSHDSTHERRF